MFEERSLQRRRRGNHGPLTIVAATAAVVTGLVLFPWAPRAQVASTPEVTAGVPAATAVTPAAADPTIVVHAGGTRSNNSTIINPAPNGAVFTATAVDNPSLSFMCTTSGNTGTCSITGLEDGHQWDVTQSSPQPSYYLNPSLGIGGGRGGGNLQVRPYTFRTPVLMGATTTDVPGPDPNGTFTDARTPNAQTFSGLFAASFNDPPPLMRCGLNIALVLDQSGSIQSGGLQPALKTAAIDTINALTGTPSTVAIYTFAINTGVSQPKTSTINAASAQPLIDFINNLPTPNGRTNWDVGLGQVINQGPFDLVVFLTDGVPNASRLSDSGNGTDFIDLDQAIFSANTIKSGGARMVGIGIGLDAGRGEDLNLRAVTGPTSNTDFFLANSATFGDILKREVTGPCNSELVITKLIQDATGALISPTPADANNRTFQNTISSGMIDPTATTGAIGGINGLASADVVITAGMTPTLTVTEVPNSSHSLVSVQCTIAGVDVPTSLNGTTATFTGQAAAPLACTFINQRHPATISHTPSPGGPVGTIIHDTATVSGGVNPTGNVTFTLFPPGDDTCSGTPVFTSTNPLSGSTATSGNFTSNAVGTFHWVATYNGDVNNPSASTACTPVTITRATPTIGTTPSAGGPVGTTIHDTATLSGGFNPTGSITFQLFPPTDTTCSGTPVFTSSNGLIGSTATSGNFTANAAGIFRWVAIYNGDVNNNSVTSGCAVEPVTITPATATIATTPSASAVTVGAAISDTATVTGFNPTGTVTFRLFPPTDPTCTGTPAFTSPPITLSGGTATSGAFTTNAAGIFHWVAVYSGDGNNAPVTSGCTAEPVTIGRATATIATTPSASTVIVGAPITDTATVTGFSPTGSVTFQLFPPADTTCTGTPAFTSANIVLTGGTATTATATSGSFTTNAAGTFHWVAIYPGDANNTPITSGCTVEPVTIGRATATIATTPSASIVIVGTPITDTATVTGLTPTGTVTFQLFPPTDPTCIGAPAFTSPPVTLSGGGTATSSSFTTNAAGTVRWVAIYSGDANNTPVTSACAAEPVTVGRATATIATTPSASTVTVGAPITDTATVTGFTPTGTVTFQLFPPSDTTCTGTAAFTSANVTLTGGTATSATATSGSFTTNAAGTPFHWVAIYGGDGNNTPVTSGCTAEPVTIGQATPTIATTPSASTVIVGAAITDTATVTGFTPTGTVTFQLFPPTDPSCSGTPAFTSANVTLTGGTATSATATSGSFTTNAAGVFHWVAIYSGDANNTPVTSGCTAEPVTIGRATPTIATTPSAGTVIVGAAMTDTATVTGFTPTGTVTFQLFPPTDTTCTGTAAFTSPNIALTGGTATSATATSGSFTTNAAGTFHWVAIYSGDANNTPITSGCTAEPVTVGRATATIATTPSASTVIVGAPITDTATVSGFNPTGTVTFELFGPSDPTCSGTPAFTSPNITLTGGTATSGSFTTNAAGTFHWVAIYSGDANNTPITSGCTAEPVTVGRATATIATTPSASTVVVGAPITDTATVTGFSPTGTVTFQLFPPTDPSCSGTPAFTSANVTLTGGTATSATATSGSFTTNAAGIFHWVAIYSGDTNNTPVTSGCTAEPVTIDRATSTIATTPSASTVIVGAAITDTATVTGFNPTGTVTFQLFPPTDTTCTGTPAFTSANIALTGGTATSATATSGSFTTNAAGIFHWVAIYSGDTNNTPVTSGCTVEPVTIARATPAIATTPSASTVIVGASITDTATVTGGFTPTGTVTFQLFPPTDPTCTGAPAFTSTNPLSGVTATSGSFATNAVGTFHWVAIYNGDANNNPVTSGCTAEPVTIDRASPTIATTPSAGGPAGIAISDTATFSGAFSPTGSVTFTLFPPSDPTCSGTPVFTSTNPISGVSATSGTFTTNVAGTFHWATAYAGDVNNNPASTPCTAEPVDITRATPSISTFTAANGRVGTPISDTATVRSSVSVAVTGTVTFNLFPPGNTTCTGSPVFSSTSALSGGSASSSPFTPTSPGTYNWVATYNGDVNNNLVSTACIDEPVNIIR